MNAVREESPIDAGQLILRWAYPVRSAAVDSVALPSRRMISAVLDAVIVAAAGLGLRRLRGRPWHDASPGAQWESLAVAGCYFVGGMAVAGRTAGQAVLACGWLMRSPTGDLTGTPR
jgi:hypothetical protein